jgi:membrane fusion protein, multidrug efflux system
MFTAKLPILAFILSAAILAGCSHSQANNPAPAAPAPAVSVAEVLARPLRDWEEFSGRLQAIDSVDLRSRVSGFIDAAPFTEGARVTKGQLLFRIDPRPFQAEVDRLSAQLRHAHAQSDLAALNHERGKQLIAKHVISQQDFDQLATTANGGNDDVGAAQAALEAARLNLEFTQVRAPIAGRVSRMLITPGNLVTSDSILTTIVSDDAVYAYFDADEQTYLKFAHAAPVGNSNGSPVYMGLTDEQGFPHEGRLNFVDNQVDPRSGTIRGRAVFDNPDHRLTPGLFARIKLVGAESHDTILIDERAVGTDLGKKFVLTVKGDNTLEYRNVTLGASIDALRVVKSGLAAGDVIVVNGLQHVQPGISVTPTRIAMDAGHDGLAQLAGAPRLAPGGNVRVATH